MATTRTPTSRIRKPDASPTRIETYVERDVRLIKNVPDLTRFDDFLRLIAGRVGQVVNYASPADDAGISHNTAKSWPSILQTSYVVQPLRPYHRNFNKQINKSPKLCFADTGLPCYLLGIERDQIVRQHPLIGGIFENFVASEFAKYYQNKGMQPRLFFWRDKRGHEVDLLSDAGGVRTENRSAATILGWRALGEQGLLDRIVGSA